MDFKRLSELKNLAKQYFDVAASHIDPDINLNQELITAIKGRTQNEEAEIPAFEKRDMKFGKFQNREFVAMMTDIRDSTAIINGHNGTIEMFLIFYVYSGIVANIVDTYSGTATEFLGDGVLSLFDVKDLSLEVALPKALGASRDILYAREHVLNPLFAAVGLPTIELGVGIDYGITIVTRFGYKSDTDLKAFGRCAYNASKLSKGKNQVFVSQKAQSNWPKAEDGVLSFPHRVELDDVVGFSIYP
jgi:class 3 adenylate cyclase